MSLKRAQTPTGVSQLAPRARTAVRSAVSSASAAPSVEITRRRPPDLVAGGRLERQAALTRRGRELVEREPEGDLVGAAETGQPGGVQPPT